ncbi:dihydrolipoamide acetyltransferase family protein [Pseudohaliea rubra]|uniref:Dihydrolipoamide acetyltransferase component of pyruvate dehydrogenase complex n=1 Tax=Pseudohaliea rubra DSM 19751 TaxID=1265313 RepID=A0A095VQH7_9GAMM|nr:dihydrolipoamide acetyltransferase family protein [Pseudohaliea rubra]KGE03707.1 Dihydrolipoamide acetyltransferase component of pyruvate dehydrogenase complex [Pseudohaliea rubra DSM 19751]
MSDAIRAFTMPKWGMEMDEGTVQEWLVAEGDTVAAGQAIVLVETDKIVNEVEVDRAGVIRRLVAETGENYPVGALLAVVADAAVPEEAIDRFVAGAAPAAAPAATGEAVPDADARPRAGGESVADGAVSPKGRALAERLGLELTSIAGTGRKGRITLQDVEQAAKQRGLLADGADAASFERVQLSGRQRTAARRLAQAKREIPHFYLERTLDVQRLVDFRSQRKAAGDTATLNDYLVRACALALGQVPEVNAQLQGEELWRFRAANIAVAMQLEDGLLTPVVKGADGLSVGEISTVVRDLQQAATANRLRAEDLQGATFTISNLGMHGVDRFSAIVNPPAVAILAVGRLATAVLAVDGRAEVRPVVQVTLSCDHRVVDGVLGARFLAALDNIIQAPDTLDP